MSKNVWAMSRIQDIECNLCLLWIDGYGT